MGAVQANNHGVLITDEKVDIKHSRFVPAL